MLQNRFCCFFCIRLTQPRSLGTGYFKSNLVGMRKVSLSPPVLSLHLASSCAIYLHHDTPLVLVHMLGGNGIGAHHTGAIELRHCDVSHGNVVWERIPKGPLGYGTLHATLQLVTELHNQLSPLIRVFHNSPTTHHNPPQLTITRHNSPQVPEVQVVAPQLTTTYLASFHLYMPLPQPATTCYNPLS